MDKSMRFLVALLSAAFVLCCVGCSGSDSLSESESSSLVVVVQLTKNCSLYDVSSCAAFVESAQDHHDTFDAICLDGKPFSLLGQPVRIGSSKSKNAQNAAAENAAERANINALLSSSVGQTDDVDVISALALADREHAAAACEGNGSTTVVYASGLSTAGALDLSKTGLALESDTAISYLESLGYSFAHTDKIVWFGLGDVDGEQPELTPVLKESLKTLYSETLIALGVGSVEFRDDIVALSGECGDDRPDTKLVDVPEPVALSIGKANKLDSETLPFLAGTATLVDEENAKETLQPFADALSGNASTITVGGSTASYPWNASYAQELGLARAQTVADLLVALGVSASRITVVSYGDAAEGHVNDIDPETGLQVPELAQLNRWVLISVDD